MADLVADLLSIEQECDQLLAEATQQAEALAKETARQIATQKQRAAESLDSEADTLSRQSQQRLASEKERLAAEHAAALQALADIPPELLQQRVSEILQRLLEA